MPGTLQRRVVAELVATMVLLAAIVGSGIMGERLAGGNVAIALLANSLATGGALFALIATFQPISGAHFNPVVTLVDAWEGGLSWRHAPIVILGQLAGAALGVCVAHLMFAEPWISVSTHDRAGLAPIASEFVATFGLVAVIVGCARRRPDLIPFAVSAYIVGAYWFTASTAFANPAVTVARSLTGTFAGIRSADVGGFVLAQLAGAAAGAVVLRWLLSAQPETVAAACVHPPAPTSMPGGRLGGV
jgi:glycerol uptake facilitator-like aquaporin